MLGQQVFNKNPDRPSSPLKVASSSTASQSEQMNQWYHYATKLELNIKSLRDQIVIVEDKCDVLTEQL